MFFEVVKAKQSGRLRRGALSIQEEWGSKLLIIGDWTQDHEFTITTHIIPLLLDVS